jgi:RimJ/RimL family protein N-acetyltransferase
MKILYREIDDLQIERLAAWLPQQSWPFHERPELDAAWVHERAEAGYFFGPEAKSFWMGAGTVEPAGLIRVFDLGDVTPLVDLRLGNYARNLGIGTRGLRWLTDWVFTALPDKHRVGGYTRHDNIAMLRVFEKCGFVQEARRREAWRVEGGGFADALGCALLRSDWSTHEGA